MLTELTSFGYHIIEEGPVRHEVVAVLLEGQAEKLSGLNGPGYKIRIDGKNPVFSRFLFSQYRQRIRVVTRSDYAIGGLRFYYLRGAGVNSITKGDPVAV